MIRIKYTESGRFVSSSNSRILFSYEEAKKLEKQGRAIVEWPADESFEPVPSPKLNPCQRCQKMSPNRFRCSDCLRSCEVPPDEFVGC